MNRPVTLCSLCLLDRPSEKTFAAALRRIEETCESAGPDLLVTPFMPFVGVDSSAAGEQLAPLRAVARRFGTYLMAAVTEVTADGPFATSFLIDRAGDIAHRWRKTHVLADDGVIAGDTLDVCRTDIGTLGATIGTDIYFPEVYEVLRMGGADILVWQHYPERFREHSGWEHLLRARAFDSHCHVVSAHYADHRPYITNRYSMGMQGAAWGRSMVLNRVGVPIADSGYEDGAAVARVNLAKRKEDPYKGWCKNENCFYVNSLGDRRAFAPVARPWQPPELPRYAKRSARIAVIAMDPQDMWRDGVRPDRLLELLDEAADLSPDLVLASEQSACVDDAAVRKAMTEIGRKAKAMKAYVCIGGVRDSDRTSVARLWDRNGRIVWQQPIYWTRGFEHITFIDTDFARISTHTCGDLFVPFFDRTLALQGVELVLDPSQMWGPCGQVNESLLRARALDNAFWMACSHWNTSDPGLRSIVVDPYGQVVAASGFQRSHVIHHDIDFSVKRVYYSGRKAQQPKRGEWDIPSYFTEDIPEQKEGWRNMIFARRRPALYGVIPTTNDVIMKYRPERFPGQ